MGFLGNLLSATVKVALTPIAVVADVCTVGNGKGSSTAEILESIKENVIDACDDAKEGDLI